MKVFCDANILLDVLAQREPFYGDSARVWTLAEGGRIRGLISVLSFSNIFYVVRRPKNQWAAQQAVLLLRDMFEPVPLEEQILNQAIDASFKDLEDAIQFFSALRCGASCFVTRNPRHFPTDEIPVQTPTEFLATHFPEQDASCQAPQVEATHHVGRNGGGDRQSRVRLSRSQRHCTLSRLDQGHCRVYNVITTTHGGGRNRHGCEDAYHQDRELARHPDPKGVA